MGEKPLFQQLESEYPEGTVWLPDAARLQERLDNVFAHPGHTLPTLEKKDGQELLEACIDNDQRCIVINIFQAEGTTGNDQNTTWFDIVESYRLENQQLIPNGLGRPHFQYNNPITREDAPDLFRDLDDMTTNAERTIEQAQQHQHPGWDFPQ